MMSPDELGAVMSAVLPRLASSLLIQFLPPVEHRQDPQMICQSLTLPLTSRTRRQACAVHTCVVVAQRFPISNRFGRQRPPFPRLPPGSTSVALGLLVACSSAWDLALAYLAPSENTWEHPQNQEGRLIFQRND